MTKPLQYLLLTATICALSLSAQAQKKSPAKTVKAGTAKVSAPKYVRKASNTARVADKYFDNEEYYLAAEYYKKAISDDSLDLYSRYKLAQAYKSYFDYGRAEDAFAGVLKRDPKAFPLAQYEYAQVLKINGKHAEAKAEFTSFLNDFKQVKTEDKAIAAQVPIDIAGCDFAMVENTNTIPDFKFQLTTPPVNSTNSDYAPTLQANDSILVVTSARPESRGDRKDPRSGQQFSDLFRFKKGANGNWTEFLGKDNFDDLNSKVNDGAGVFNTARTKFYYTSCNSDEVCMLYVSEMKDGKWQNPKPLNDNINMPNFTSKQPAISTSGDTLFFVSNRPGGLGGNDIWMATSTNASDNWGVATNLTKVNTARNDMSPNYYSKENLLFFASDGRPSFGGLDIFMGKGKDFADIKNVGLPFNSNRDDFYFVMGTDFGFLSSNRDGGIGSDDIYQFQLSNVADRLYDAIAKKDSVGKNPKVPLVAESVEVKGDVKEDNKPVADAIVPLQDETGTTVKTTKTDKDGKFKFKNLDPKKKYKVGKVKQGKTEEELATEATLLAERKAAKDKAAQDKLDAMADIRATKNAKVKAAKKAKLEAMEAAAAAKQAKLDAMAEASAAKKAKASAMADAKAQAKTDLDASNVSVTASNKKVRRFLYENIYFDFDKSDLRPEATAVLDDIISYIKKNPEVQMELNSYTDNIGDAAYNLALSQRRAEAAQAYLKANGLDNTNVAVNAKGLETPIATNGNSIGRRLNRRVEFFILGGPEYHTAMVYVSNKATTASEVAKKYGMDVADVKAMNNLQTEEIQAYTPVRVKKAGGIYKHSVVAPATINMGGVKQSKVSVINK